MPFSLESLILTLTIHQIRIHKFLEKTKKKKVDKGSGDRSDTVVQEQEKLRKKVSNLMKKQKLQAVRQIVKGQDDLKPWGPDAKAKVRMALMLGHVRLLIPSL